MFRKFTVSFLIVVLCGLLVAGCVPLGFCTFGYWYREDNIKEPEAANWLSNGAVNDTVGQAITGDGGWLYSASFYVKPTVAATGSIKAGLWQYNDSSSNYDLVENASNTVSLAGVAGWTWINFTFSSMSYLNASLTYVVGLYFSVAASAQVYIGEYVGSGFRYVGTGNNINPVSSWTVTSAAFTARVVSSSTYGGTEEDGGGWTPPSGGEGEEGSVDNTIASLMWWFIYLIVMLAPAWFLGGYLKMGKWGFVVGLAIGAGIGYAFLSGFPLWLLILVAVGEAGLVYSTVSREG